MAYNNYFPATYQPYYYPQYQQSFQPMQQQIQPQQNFQMQQAAQQQTQPTYNTSRIWVNGKSEADFFPVGPNTAVDLWDSDGKTLYQKRADATGKPSLIICDVTERAETPSDGADAKDGKSINYATKDDLSAIVGVVKDFSGVLDGIKSDVDGMKKDLYGALGRNKKPVQKKEDVEE